MNSTTSNREVLEPEKENLVNQMAEIIYAGQKQSLEWIKERLVNLYQAAYMAGKCEGTKGMKPH